jgi:hypothetical protein
MKADTAFDAMERMGFQAATFGEFEFVHGLDFLRQQIKKHPNLFTSANVLDNVTGKPLAQPYVIRTYPVLHGRPAGKKQIKVAILGVLGKGEANVLKTMLKADANQIRVTDPAEELQKLLPKLRPKVDYVVVLAHTGLQDSMDLAKAVNGINLLVIGHAIGVYLNEAPVVNGATLVCNSDRARFGAQAAVTFDGATPKVATRQTPLSESYPDNSVLALLRDEYKARLAASGGGVISEQEFTPVAIFFPASGGNRYVGSEACAVCHSAAVNQWEKHPHSQALHTLQVTKNGINSKRPDCVRCHTVGFGQPTGFKIATPNKELAGVGCETCHGPGRLHISRAMAGVAKPGFITRTVSQGAKALCVRCHNPINDPDFNFDKAFAKIRHWGPGFSN